MAEPTSSYTRTQLRSDVGHFLGYGRGVSLGETAWTVPQTNDINAQVKSGENQIYVPPPINGVAHNWSFMRPYLTLVTISGQRMVPLPDDFGGFVGELFLVTPGTIRPFSIPMTTPERVQQAYSGRPSASGSPGMAAEVPLKGSTLTTGQRFALDVFPLPDGVYTLKGQYYFVPDTTTDLLPFTPGGALTGELFKASCLAAAELQLDDAKGPRWEFFMERLAAAVAADGKRKVSGTLGYNGDPSDGRGWRHDRRHGWGDYVSFNGVFPD